jgi:hypothetical protein
MGTETSLRMRSAQHLSLHAISSVNIRSKMGKGPHDSNETDSYAKLLQPFKSQKAYFTSVDS